MPPKAKEPPEDVSTPPEETCTEPSASCEEELEDRSRWCGDLDTLTLTSREAGWKDMQPHCRYSAVSIPSPRHPGNSLFVIFGGAEPEYHNTVHQYEAVTYKWSVSKMQGAVPQTFFSHCYGVHEGALYVWGGFGNTGFMPQLYKMNTTSLFWEHLKAMEGVVPDYIASASAVHNGRLYCFGGRSSPGTVTGDVYVLNLTTHRWKMLDLSAQPYYDDTQQLLHYRSASTAWDARPLPRFNSSLTLCGDSLYAFGGHDVVGDQIPSDKMESPNILFRLRLDVEDKTHRWQALKTSGDPPPARIYGHTVVNLKGLLICLGGHHSHMVHALSPEQLRWTVPSTGAHSERHPPPLAVSESVQVRTQSVVGPHKGTFWASANVTKVNASGTYDLQVIPSRSCKMKGPQSSIARTELRKVSRPLFSQRCFCTAEVLDEAIVVFGGLQVCQGEGLFLFAMPAPTEF